MPKPDRYHHIPHGAWPRGLDSAQAAAYVGQSKTTFLAYASRGIWPNPITLGKRKIWDIKALNKAFDRLMGDDQSSSADPWLERLKHGKHHDEIC